jgi:hypothetical protein
VAVVNGSYRGMIPRGLLWRWCAIGRGDDFDLPNAARTFLQSCSRAVHAYCGGGAVMDDDAGDAHMGIGSVETVWLMMLFFFFACSSIVR